MEPCFQHTRAHFVQYCQKVEEKSYHKNSSVIHLQRYSQFKFGLGGFSAAFPVGRKTINRRSEAMLSVRLHYLMSFRNCLCRSYVTQCDLLHYFRMSQLINLDDAIPPMLGLQLRLWPPCRSLNRSWTALCCSPIIQRNAIRRRQTPRVILVCSKGYYNESTKPLMESPGIQTNFASNTFCREVYHKGFWLSGFASYFLFFLQFENISEKHI